MKLKAYSHDNPLKHSILHTIKHYLWLPFVILALSAAVFVATELVTENRMLSSGFLQQSNILFVFNNSEIWEAFPVFLVAISAFSAYIMFSFLFKKKSSAMFLLTGISRIELFLSRYIFGLLSTLIPVIASFFVMLMLGADNLEKSLVFNKNMLIILSMVAMLIIFTYTLLVIAITLCGRKLEFFAVAAVFVFGGQAILLFVGLLFNAFVHGFAYPMRRSGNVPLDYEFNELFDKYSWVSPCGIFKDAFTDYVISGYNAEISLDIYSSSLIRFSVLTLVLIPLSIWLFKRRNAEFDGKSNANKTVSAICSIIPALALSSLVFAAGNSVLNIIIALAGFALLTMLFYAFFNGTVREIFRSFKFIAPATAVFALFIILVKFDFIGYSNTIPDIDEVDSVIVSYKGKNDSCFDGGGSGFTSTGIISSSHNLSSLPVLTAKEDIQTAMNIHEIIISDGSMKPSPQSLENYSDTAVYVDYSIVYKLKNGNEIVRSYPVMKLSTLYSTLEIETTAAYRENLEKTIKSGFNKINYDETGKTVENCVYASNNLLSDLTEINLTAEQKEKLIDAVISDKLNETVEDAYHPDEDCLGVLWMSKPNSNGMTSDLSLPEYIAVYENDKNILSFLDSNGFNNIFDASLEIKSIELYSYDFYGRDYTKALAIDRSYMSYYNRNIFDQPSLYHELGNVPEEDWAEVLNKSYLVYFRDNGNKYAVITMTNANGEERIVTKFINE